jgi:hypothetical protein
MPVERTPPSEARCSAASSAHSTADDAVSWITPCPRNDPGRSSSSASQSSTTVSSSVAAGDVAHNMPCTPSPDDSRSPSTAGPDAFAGKYAKNEGCCQCVTPGRMTRSRSASTAENGSPVSGADDGSAAATSPGFTCAPTGSDSTRSQ